MFLCRKCLIVLVFLIEERSVLSNIKNSNYSNFSLVTSVLNNISDEIKESSNLVKGFTHTGRRRHEDMMEKLFPMMVIPFLVSTALMPLILFSLKIMLLKSAFIGKMAVLLLILNMFRNRSTGEGGVYNHNVNMPDMAYAHYGYGNAYEYGSYINQ